MKKILTLALLGASLISGYSASVTVTLNPYVITNVIPFGNGANIQQVILTSQSTNEAIAYFYDSPTSTNLTYVTQGYTNTISYATNLPVTWTNFYGVSQSVTNVALVDITNNYVAPATNSWPLRMVFTSPANASTTFSGTSYQFTSGVIVTNATTNIISVGVTYF